MFKGPLNVQRSFTYINWFTSKTTEEESEVQSCSSDLPSFPKLVSQGQYINLQLLTPGPKIFLERVHLENLSLWKRRMDQAVKTDESLLSYSPSSALIPYLLSNCLNLIHLLSGFTFKEDNTHPSFRDYLFHCKLIRILVYQLASCELC